MSHEEFATAMPLEDPVLRLLDGSETLLIGAGPSGKRGLRINYNCQNSISKSRLHLRDLDRLCIIGASKSYFYNDSNQFQLQVGYGGLNAAATKQYKRVPGQSLKMVLIELWAMEPDIRDPRILLDLYGVDVSLCTHNAHRISLCQLLAVKCMRILMRDFQWETEQYRNEFFATLEDPSRTLRKSDAAFRRQFEQAVILCLRVLGTTGVDRKGNLLVFMASECTFKPELATMVSKEHNWIGLLRDTTTDCAMAVFGDKCLEFQHASGVKCGGTGRSTFLTSIVLNGLAQPLPVTRMREVNFNGSGSWVSRWDVSSLEVGKVFWLGERGTLSLKSHLKDGALLVEWRLSPITNAVRMLIGKEQPHREYAEMDHGGENQVRPIPVYVIADRVGED